MTLHYVYVDSRKKNEEESKTNFTVSLHTPLKNVIRCGLTQFSKGNNSFNVGTHNNEISWIEIVESGTGSYTLNTNTITLDVKYYSILELLTTITTKMSATTGRTYAGEQATTYSYTIDEDYRVSIEAQASSSPLSNRYWAFVVPINQYTSSILHATLGYTRNQLLSKTDDISHTDSRLRQSQTIVEKTVLDRSVKAQSSYIENHSVLYLGSDVLTKHSQRMIHGDDISTSSTMRCNYLETIPVSVNRWSYIHLNKHSVSIQYHSLHNVNISHFDLKLYSEHEVLLNDDEESDYKTVLVFETLDETHHEIKEMYKEYNASAYALANRRVA